MASSKDYLEFVLEQLSELQEITYRAMITLFSHAVTYVAPMTTCPTPHSNALKFSSFQTQLTYQWHRNPEFSLSMYSCHRIVLRKFLYTSGLASCKSRKNTPFRL